MNINDKKIKTEHIRATFAMLAHQTPVELRIFPKNGSPVVETAATEQAFIEICGRWNGKAQIYCGMRERRAGFLDGKGKGKAGDENDIVAVTLTVVDVDPIRAEGFAKQPTTDEELAKAILASSLLAQWHEGRGFLRPARAMSGNGVQLWFAIPRWEVTDANREEIPERLAMFEEECRSALPSYIRNFVSIDSIHDLPRIIKVIGTQSVKGKRTHERPHRVSHWIDDERSPLVIGRQEDEKFLSYLMEITEKHTSQQSFSAKSTQSEEKKKEDNTTSVKEEEAKEESEEPDSTLDWRKCEFLEYCEKNAKTLSEPLWYAMLSSLCRFGNEGRRLAHQLSRPYPGYNSEETDKKLDHAYEASGPITCKEIAKRGFRCPSLERCKAKAPAALLKNISSRKTTAKEVNLFEGKEDKSGAGEIALRFLLAHFAKDDVFTLRYYREDWWQWNGPACAGHADRRCYKELPTTDLRGRIARFLDDETTNEVSQNLVSSVLEALRGRCLVPAWAERPVFLGDNFETKNAGHVVVFENGILDFDALLSGENVELQPHTPTIFTPVALPYPFDENADCPEWLAFLNHNLEGDKERIAVLQEFVGYCLFWDTRCHKFLLLEGESRTGKSTFTDIVTALLGEENVSHVPLEAFGQRFALSSTLGKLANICGDTGEIDSVAEGQFKQFTGGDRMDFERKYRDQIHTYPTARVIIATNNRPRFLDRSEAIWERMILVPWNKVIPKEERDEELRERIKRNELPSILIWALAGEARRREQGHFTQAQAVYDAIEDYKRETNPAREFLYENYEADEEGIVDTQKIYAEYAQWCRDCGYHALGERNFGKEVRRVFPQVQRIRKRNDFGTLHYVYCGITQQK